MKKREKRRSTKSNNTMQIDRAQKQTPQSSRGQTQTRQSSTTGQRILTIINNGRYSTITPSIQHTQTSNSAQCHPGSRITQYFIQQEKASCKFLKMKKIKSLSEPYFSAVQR